MRARHFIYGLLIWVVYSAGACSRVSYSALPEPPGMDLETRKHRDKEKRKFVKLVIVGTIGLTGVLLYTVSKDDYEVTKIKP